MDRRSFLVGSGAILTTSFLDRAHWYLEKKASVVPLLKPAQALDTLYFINEGTSYELRLGSQHIEFPDYTYRDALEHYFSVYFPKDAKTSLSEFRSLYKEYGISPKQLDQPADSSFYINSWGRSDSANAQAYHYLYGLDLFGPDDEDGLRRGDLQFIDGYHPGNDYLGVRSDDPVTASLLQARLLELDHKLEVKIVDHS